MAPLPTADVNVGTRIEFEDRGGAAAFTGSASTVQGPPSVRGSDGALPKISYDRNPINAVQKQ